ncbi:cation-translocating P-type ATPase [Alkalinema sp. FACHB-956]|uniref:cation-translocating P-type ATPase n=1 Tax=Alkalinema sp. FACHB-956 TaxID=2692768 RepID=UPI0016826F42|nr:cation-translocating P-type ATPase [Alkalinema sp. FACHB-956]MBD2328771.1 cation-translocating P-type ATPase [Alkalinema sp. FACHB-956]
MGHWYQLDTIDVLQQLDTDATKGLSREAVNRRREQWGSNELADHRSKSPWLILWEQLTASTIVVLLLAALAAIALGDSKDAIAIVAIVALTVLLGWSQEYRAEKALVALKQLAVPSVRVYRAGTWMDISARDLVPGDIVHLEAGNRIPADGRLLETAHLQVQEAALTGESAPVEKSSPALTDEAILAESAFYPNMVYMGTTVTAGRGKAVITATGMQTELGNVANLMQRVGWEATPLQQRLDQLSQKLVLAILALVAIIFALGVLRGESLPLMFLTAVSVAVGLIPEGLPAIVTISLALGSQRMLKQQALIRRLPAVETLGSVTVICSDKTGTLTENRMTVTTLEVAEQRVSLPSASESPFASESPLAPSLQFLLLGAALCNDAIVPMGQESVVQNEANPLGDPTEVALVIAASLAGLSKSDLDMQYPRIAEIGFEADRRCMTTIHKWNGDGNSFSDDFKGTPYIAFTKGAVTQLLDVTSHIWVKDHIQVFDATWRDRVLKAQQELAQTGARVLGVAFRLWNDRPDVRDAQTVEQNLVLVGWVGLRDPARPEVKQAVQDCQRAGIRPVMITGDHPLTALHLARELGIADNDRYLTGHDLNQLSLAELMEKVESIAVYARVSPEQKLKIVQAFQQRQHIVAMTGDGINDAPALRKADIGVAMGKSGTDVAKEAADMVLLDDHFATIVAAVQEGRVIYDNIRKSIKYLLSGNSGEIWVMFLAPFLGMPLPLLPIQILWINLMSDGLPALALSVEPAERDTMQRPPHQSHGPIFSRGMGWDIVWIGLLTGLASLGTGYVYWQGDRLSHWQTMLFTILTFSETVIALAVRSERYSLFQIGLLSNKPLLGAIVLTLGFHLAILYVPLLQTLFQTTALSISELVFCLGMSSLVFWAIELQKWLRRKQSPIHTHKP